MKTVLTSIVKNIDLGVICVKKNFKNSVKKSSLFERVAISIKTTYLLSREFGGF